MRKIKFRGRRANGIVVTGGIIFKRGNPMIAVTHCLQFPVEPKSVAQLIAVDCEGKEIYEGDKVLTANFIHVASFIDYTDILRGECTLVKTQYYDLENSDSEQG